MQLGDGGLQSGGLAGAGGADHHNKRRGAGDLLSDGVLRVIEPSWSE